MKSLIESTINWNKIGKHPKDKYNFSIGRSRVSKESHILTIVIELNFIIPYDDSLRIKALILNQIPDLKQVIFEFKFEEMILTEEEICKNYVPYMIESANGEFTAITKTIFLEETTCKNGVVTIFALGDVAVHTLNERVAPQFKMALKQNFGLDMTIFFQNHKGVYKETEEKKNAEAEKEFSEVAKQQKVAIGKNSGKKPSEVTYGNGNSNKSGNGGGKFGKWQAKEDPVVGNKIMGKHISEGQDITNLSELNENIGKVVVEGIVFKKESRTIKEDTRLVTLLITDKITSTCVKAFVNQKKWEDIDEHINSGDYIKVGGNTEFDTYENMVVVKGRDIEKGTPPKRTDLSEDKRVELHSHTKMSAMDGLNEVSDMIITAASWGHKAIAITDHGVVQAFPEAAKIIKKKKLDIKVIYGLEGYLFDDTNAINEDGTIDYKTKGTNHIIILAQTQEGLKNLYKLVSLSHLNYFYKRPRIPKSILTAHREGLVIGSACEAGEVYRSILENKGQEEIEKIAGYYDYLEIQPLVNNQFLIDNGTVANEEELKDINRQIVGLGEKLGKPVAATCDAHYSNPEEALYRRILMAGQGYKDAEGGKGLHLRTTHEMLDEFGYLGSETASKVVIEYPNQIAEMIEVLSPVPSGKFPPKIDNADEILRNKCMETAWGLYGNPLPERIQSRLDRELNSIINNGYAVMYVSAEMLVQKSMSDGYLVGSRGSVGSSFAATMAGITEVNPLHPHYICPKCKELEWGDPKKYDCGVDMPTKNCPKCGTEFKQEGFTIPFEVFLGFEGDKEPDIDLNFAGEYQPVAHKYVEEIFGSENVYRAGTIGTVAEKTAYGFVMKYFEEKQQPINKWEADRLTLCCTGVRRTTGQHPGGIIIVPRGHEIYEFCPVQHPANDTKTDIITTHFDYHSIDENLLKLDILGHDVPSMIRHLQDMTGVDPLTLPLKDEKVNSIFNGIEGLDIKINDYRFVHGSYGIPEFGTKFVRQMLDDTNPKRFADLVRISGLSHGTDVWINNAQLFIREGAATINDVISTRDDIMNYLILKGLPNKSAFKIMENVRKGKGITEEESQLMAENDVPEWYIESCRRIKYMFPRAHAVAYVMMSYRIAYYKVYHPAEFYAVHFTIKISEFDAETILKGAGAITNKIELIRAKGKNATKKEEDEIAVLEVAYEMYSRGYEFLPARFGKSKAAIFYVVDGKVQIPFAALTGLAENAAKVMVAAFEEKSFFTIEEIKNRAKINKTAMEALKIHGALEGLPESDQMSLF